MEDLSRRPGDRYRYPTEDISRITHRRKQPNAQRVNPYTPSTTRHSGSGRFPGALYLPAGFCWLGSLAYLTLFCVHVWASIEMPWTFEGERAFRIVVAAYSIIGLALLVCATLSCWLGFRARRGKWKSSVAVLLLSCIASYATVSASFGYLMRVANS